VDRRAYKIITTFVIPAHAGIQVPRCDEARICPNGLPYGVKPQRHSLSGVTSNPLQRVAQHRQGLSSGFTDTYCVKMLVWFDQHETMESAIQREKRIKKWRRTWKLELIETGNPDWRDFATDFGFDPLQETGFLRSQE
jgi:putative endonuclease